MNSKPKVKKNSDDKNVGVKKPGFKKYSKEVKEHIADLIRQGKTLSEILEQVEPKKKSVLRVAKKYNLQIQK